MAGFQDQQALQQLLAGMNTMQMQAGLMPGGLPINSQPPPFVPPRVPTPAEFSNNLEVNYSRRFNPVTSLPPMFSGVSPVPRNDYAFSMLPPSMLGSGWGAARQAATGSANRMLTGAHLVSGIGGGLGGTAIGASMGAGFGGAAGLLFGGPAGMKAGAAIGSALGGLAGGGAGYYGADLAFSPFITQRERALQLQNTSLLNVRTGPDLSASGIGLSGGAAMHFERNLMGISDNRQFKRDTYGMFNRQDMMKMTSMSAQVGLLDNTQSVEQMTKEMGKIGRALSVFMRVVEEPDVQEALKMMGRMRNLGMSIPETNMAAANARTFARMAGTTVQGVMAQGMQGAGLFQQYGMTGATGFNAGMAATGLAGAMSTQMDPRQLALLNGREGMAQNLLTASAKFSQMDMLLPGLAKMNKDGTLGIDQSAMLEFAKGTRNVNQLMQHSAQRLSGMGPQGFIEAYQRDRGDLQDQLMKSLGGKGAVLAPLLMAKAAVETGAAKTVAGGLAIAGFDEKEIKTLDTAFRQPDFFKNLETADRAQQFTEQALRKRRRDLQSDYAGSEGWDRLLAPFDWSRRRRSMGRTFDEFFQNKFGTNVDIREIQSASGGGAITRIGRPSLYGSSEQIDQMRSELKGERGVLIRNAASGMGAAVTNQALGLQEAVGYEQGRVPLLSSLVSGQRGPEGFGIGPKSEYITETINRNQGLGERFNRIMGSTPEWARTTQGLTQKISAVQQFGGEIERGLASANDPRKLRDYLVRMEAAGVKRETAMKMLSQASAGLESHLESTHLMGITMTSADPNVITRQMRDRAGVGVGKSQLDAFMADEGTRELVIGMGAGSRSDASQATLNKAIDAGSDVANSMRVDTLDNIRAQGEVARKGALGHLGIVGTAASEEEKARLLDVFGAQGDDAELRKKAAAILAIEASAKYDVTKGKRDLADKKNARAAEMRNELLRTVGDSEEGMKKIDAAFAAAQGSMSTISRDTQVLLGERLGIMSQTGYTKAMYVIGKKADTYKGADLVGGLADKLGKAGYAAYAGFKSAEGATEGSIREQLKAYLKNGGALGSSATAEERERMLAGEMSTSEIEDMGAKAAGSDVAVAVAGGGTSVERPKTDVEANAEAVVKTLEEWQGKMLERANESYDKLDTASTKLLTFANKMRKSSDDGISVDDVGDLIALAKEKAGGGEDN